MRMPLISVALSLALASAASAQTPPKEPEFSAERVRAHVAFLADDRLEGRNAGTSGYQLAADYVAARFKELGLKPGGPDGSWFQQVSLAEYALDERRPASLRVGSASFANMGDVLIAPSPRYGTEPQTVAAEAVFAGHGLESDYAGLDVQGKIAVVLFGVPKGLAPDASQAALKQDKARNAGSRGAAGILYVIRPQDTRAAFPWAAAAGYLLGPQKNWLDSSGFPGGNDPGGVRIGAYVKGAAAEALFAGSPLPAGVIAGTAELPDGPVKGFPLGKQVTLERTSKVAIARSPNVIGILPGSDPTLAAEHVVLSAHLDHEGRDPKLTGDQIFNGALDNAGGVATMIEAARAFAQSGVRPRRSILFVALTAEEDGLLGSEYLARYPVVGSGKVVADVNLDMPILLYDFQDVVAFGAEHSTLGPIVARAGAKMGVTLSPDPMPEENLFVRSDHYSFVKQGVPSVFLVTGFKNGGEKAFRDFLATHYHKVSDQLTLPINWEAGAKFARINYLIAREIADAPEAPRWYEGNVYGERYAKGAPKAPRPAASAGTAAK
jgi:hypothetical protein